VLKQIEAHGFKPHMSKGEETTVIGVIGDRAQDRRRELHDPAGRGEGHPDPEALQAREPRLPRRRTRSSRVGDVRVGGGTFTVMAGPLRGRIPRADHGVRPQDFEDGGRRSSAAAPSSPARPPTPSRASAAQGLEILAQARQETGLPVITEVMTVEDVPLVAEFGRHPPGRPPAIRRNFNLLDACGTPAQAGAPQARPERDHRRAAAERRVHPFPRQPERHPLRARHPHVREGDAEHARHLGRPGAEESCRTCRW